MTQTRDNEPRYVISVAARMLGMQTHTLRYYERIGIIEPSRSSGNIRLYSEEDLELLKRVRALVSVMGVNLAGVEVILRMLRHLNEVNREVEELREEVKKLKEVES